MIRPLNIAIIGKDFLWGGGTELLRIITNSLISVKAEHKTKLFLLLPSNNKIDTFTDILGVICMIVVTAIRERKLSFPKLNPVADHFFLDYFKNVDGNIEIVEYNKITGLVSALRRIKADVVMPVGNPLRASFPIPWVGYIPDFQHKYYPEFFSAKECLKRDTRFAAMLRSAKAIIVNARSVKEDIEKYFPNIKCEVFTLPFSAAPISKWLENDKPNLLKRYNLPFRYFLISNQFWIHKSHITAFQALAMLLNDQNCTDLHIVCTGKMEDHRFPGHLRDLQNEICKLGIENNVHFLGHIPKIDQITIMKNSLAVLQPTLFEGGPGGGSVYDAISIGVPAIISDIAVNREIEYHESLFFFKTGSAIDLAEKLRIFLNKDIKRPSKQELIARGEQRKRLMGERLMEVIRYVHIYPSVQHRT